MRDLPCPRSQKAFLVSVVPSLNEDPYQSGLLLVTAEGTIRFWDNLSYDLNDFREQQLVLEGNDQVTNLLHVEPVGYIVGTSSSDLFKISLYGDDAMPQLEYYQIKAQQGGLLNSFSLFGEQKPRDLRLVSLCSAPIDGKMSRDILVLTNSSIERWIVSKNQSDRKVYGQPILDLIVQSVRRDSEVSFDPYVQLLDIKAIR